MVITKINKPSVQTIRHTLRFNKRLISVQYAENIDLLSFKFWDHSYKTPSGKEIDYFAMSKTDCDYAAFEVFAYRCIDGFDPEGMTHAEIIKKSQDIYRATVSLLQKTSPLQKFLSDHRKISKKLIEQASAKAHKQIHCSHVKMIFQGR